MRCGECGTELEKRDGCYVCPSCGWWIEEDEAEDYDYDEYQMNKNGPPRYDDMPEGCASCGGDYPNCVESCPLMES